MFKQHLGYGSFVAEFLQTCILDNLYILHGLYNIDYFEDIEVIQMDTTAEYTLKSKRNISLFDEIIK